MRTPSWESSPGALAALLNAKAALQMADLLTIRYASGAVLRVTSWGESLTFNGNTFLAGGTVPGFSRGKVRQTVGVSVDTLALKLIGTPSVLIGGRPIGAAAAAGAFDRADVTVEKVFSDAGPFSPVGVVTLFTGQVGQVRPTRSGAEMEVVSHMVLLDTMVPADVYQPGCRNNVFDLNCGVSRASYTFTLTAAAASSSARTRFTTSIASPTLAQSFELGQITGANGANAGVTRSMKSVTLVSGTTYTVEVLAPWPSAVAPGDQFNASFGCDKRVDTCRDRFSNLIRFRGEPRVPVPETITW